MRFCRSPLSWPLLKELSVNSKSCDVVGVGGAGVQCHSVGWNQNYQFALIRLYFVGRSSFSPSRLGRFRCDLGAFAATEFFGACMTALETTQTA